MSIDKIQVNRFRTFGVQRSGPPAPRDVMGALEHRHRELYGNLPMDTAFASRHTRKVLAVNRRPAGTRPLGSI
jgi:hypothetical protein